MGTCPTNTDGSLTPFVAKYCTALGYDMDMLRTMSAQELICAMSEKLNEAVCFDNETRKMMEELSQSVDMQIENIGEYVSTPHIMGEWDESTNYKTLSVVLYNGNSYTAIKDVPAGVLPSNTNYWALTSNYNAQLDGLINHRIVVFGDSWTDWENVGDWSISLNKILKNCTFYNYGVSGSTLSTGLINQVNTETTPDKENIEYVIIVGGVNDASASTPYSDGLSSAITTIKNKFTSAKIVFTPSMCLPTGEYYQRYINAVNYFQQFKTYTPHKDTIVGTPFFMGVDNPFSTDNVHLSQSGADLFGNYIASLLGCCSYNFNEFYMIHTPQSDDAVLNIVFKNNDYMCEGLINIATTSATSFSVNLSGIASMLLIKSIGNSSSAIRSVVDCGNNAIKGSLEVIVNSSGVTLKFSLLSNITANSICRI